MRHALLTTIFLIFPLATSAQTSDAVSRSAAVRDVVGTIATSKKKSVELILNDLREFRGKIVAAYDDAFFLEPKKIKPSGRRTIRIRYSDVLQLVGKDAAISFVPDPAANRYSTWEAVNSLAVGDFLQVHRSPGGTIHGVYYRSTGDSLTLMKGNKEVVVPAADITKVYRVKGDTRRLATKVLTGGDLGRKLDEDGWPIWFPISIGDPLIYVLPVAVLGTAAATTLFVLSIGKTQRVLVYSR